MDIKLKEANIVELISLLKKSGTGMTITFLKKKKVEIRVMNCTLNESLIPQENKPKSDDFRFNKELTGIRVFDLDLQAWRSFDYDTITNIQIRMIH